MDFFRGPKLASGIIPSLGPNVSFLSSRDILKKVGHNTGNMAFVQAIFLHVHDLKPFGDQSPPADVRIMACANQINPTLQLKPLDPGGLPVVAIGLGAQAPSTDCLLDLYQPARDWVESIQQLAPGSEPNISLRGEYTYRVLESWGLHRKAIVLGCPSLFLGSGRKLGDALAERCRRDFSRVAVASGRLVLGRPEHVALERSLARIAFETGGSFICQHPVELIQMIRGEYSDIKIEIQMELKRTLLPDMSLSEFRAWFRSSGYFGTDVWSWGENLRRHDLVIGPRIHGVALAIQNGVPGVCVAIDSRIAELCETMHIPCVPFTSVANGIDMKLIIDIVRRHNWDRFDQNRIELGSKYVNFLRSNRIKPTDYLVNRLIQ